MSMAMFGHVFTWRQSHKSTELILMHSLHYTVVHIIANLSELKHKSSPVAMLWAKLAN